MHRPALAVATAVFLSRRARPLALRTTPVVFLHGFAGGARHWDRVLASLAVGLVVQMVTPWSRRAKPGAYLSYDGNSGLVTEAERFRCWSASCTH